MESQVKVFYGTAIIQATLLERVTEGVLKGWVKLRFPDGHVGLMSGRWCNPETRQASADTDWRAYLKAHWDNERNHLRTDCLNEFYDIFRRAAAAYFNNKQNHEQVKDNSQHQPGAHEPRRTDELLHQSGRQRPAAVPKGDTQKVRKPNKRIKPVELSLFPDL